MSNTQFAFIKKEKVPNKEKWQEAIDELYFSVNLQLDPELKPFEDDGFSPCMWNDSDEGVGFEIYYEPSDDIHNDDEDLMNIVADKDYCISMCWTGSIKDCAAVMIASCALQRSFGAIISYDGDDPASFDDLVSGTKDIIREAEVMTEFC